MSSIGRASFVRDAFRMAGHTSRAPRAAQWLPGFVPMVQFQTHKKDILRSVKAKL